MTEHEDNLRDLAAMFAMCGLIMRGSEEDKEMLGEEAYIYADALLRAREGLDQGIAALKPKKKKASE